MAFYWKDKDIEDKRNAAYCMKLGKFYSKWTKLQNIVLKIVESAFYNVLITVCIIINTLIMALQHYDQPPVFEDMQNYSNYVI